MIDREQFFTFNWLYLIGLLCFVASAWLSQGLLFVLVACAIAGVVVGIYYLVWRWSQGRSA